MTATTTQPQMNQQPGAPAMPRNVIVVLLDSLNRHMLKAYGGDEFETPNLNRLAERSLRFERHFAGSLPCMPARHDILCGALDFLWRPWGSIEIWEDAITRHLRAAGVTTMLCSDHPHLFETGGENYHTDFTAWEYLRGHEGDAWKTRPDPSWMGTPALPAATSAYPHGYDNSRTWFREEDDFPGPKTMAAATHWLDVNAGFHDRFMLFIDEFDPHEPFDTPEPYASMYDPDWNEDRIIWPPYVDGGVRKGVISERQGRHVRANYGGKLTMIDRWFGKLLDSIDRNGLWDDTAVILCTDHGHYLGERDMWGKPSVPVYEQMGHIPMMIAWPGAAARNIDALTTSVDISATLAEIFGVAMQHRTHGKSLVPLLTGASTSVREHALQGYWGRQVQVTDGAVKYGRAPVDGNMPLAMWSNRWSTMPISVPVGYRMPRPDRRAKLDFMPGSDVPVIRQPFQAGDMLPFWAMGKPPQTTLFDISEDPAESANRIGDPLEKRATEMLRAALEEVDAPPEQYERLGLG
jgi:arylsulfatase A-like enzyme